MPTDRTTSCLTVAGVLIAVAIAAFAFRVWRDHDLRRKHQERPGGLVGVDFLIFAPLVLSVFLVELPLLTIPNPSSVVQTVAQGSCAVSAALIAVYPIAVVGRHRMEKKESELFVVACLVAALSSVALFLYC